MKKVLYLFRQDDIQFSRGGEADQFFKKIGFVANKQFFIYLQYFLHFQRSNVSQQDSISVWRRRTDRRTAFFYQVRY